MTTTRRKAELPRFPRLTVLGWFRVAFAALAVLVVIAAVVIAWLLIQGRREAADLENSVLPAQAQAYRMQGALVDQETGVRGFALARSPSFLQPYTAGLATETSAVARLRTLIGGNRRLWAQVAGIEAAAGAWRRSYAMPLIALARRGPLSSGDAALLDQSKHSFDQLRTLFGAQNAGLAATASRDSSEVRNGRNLIDWGYAAVLLAVLLAAGGAEPGAAAGRGAAARPAARGRAQGGGRGLRPPDRDRPARPTCATSLPTWRRCAASC